MPDFSDTSSGIEWSGRPQDDPELRAGQDRARARFRAEHPPITCWIDGVSTVELFQNGVLRARVERGRSLIIYFDDTGAEVSAAVYLCSQNPYDLVEAHLGIAPVAEIRDESVEAEAPISAWPREREAREVAAFRRRYGEREDEIFLYLRSAVSALHLDARGGGAALDLKPLLDAIVAAVQDDYDSALVLVRAMADTLDSSAAGMLLGVPALADCRRAATAIERHIAIQQKLPSGR